MNAISRLLILAFTLFSVSSCSLEKRMFIKGYHVKRSIHKQDIESNTLKMEVASSKVVDDNKDSNPDDIESTDIASVYETPIFSLNIKAPKNKSGTKLLKSNVAQRTRIGFVEENAQKITTFLESNKDREEVHPIFSPFNSRPKTIYPPNESEWEPMEISGFAVAGFILGILGLIFVLMFGWSFLLGLISTVFSAIGLSQTLNGRKGKGFAIVGLITGILAMFIFWAILLVIIAFVF